MPDRCSCGRVAREGSPSCCTRCPGQHTVACAIRQVAAAPPRRFRVAPITVLKVRGEVGR